MDFGKILDQWDHQSGGGTGSVYNKDAELDSQGESPAERRRRLHRKSPDETIDLHGLTRDEAWDKLQIFFAAAKSKGLEKLLVIHGKGNHNSEGEVTVSLKPPEPESEETGVLKKLVRDFIERCPFAGESGYSDAANGGTGSTWVLLKN